MKTNLKFEELSEDVQDHVIETLGIDNSQYWDARDDLDNYWKDELKDNGFENAEFGWCIGSYSGEDGVCFDAFVQDSFFVRKFKKTLKTKKEKKLLDLAFKNDMAAFKIEGDSRHRSHKRERYVDFADCAEHYDDFIDRKFGDNEFSAICFIATMGTGEEMDSLLERLKNFIEAEREEWCDEIYKSLFEDYEYQSSRECVIELIDANDYRFDEYGDIVRHDRHRRVVHTETC